MYVCVCHAVTEDDVHGCVSAGAASAKEVRAACGMRLNCGSCTKRLCALVRQSTLAAGLGDIAQGEVVTAA